MLDPVSALIVAGGTIGASALSKGGGGGGGGYQQTPLTANQKKAEKLLVELMGKKFKYPVQPTVGLTDIEQTGLDRLRKLVSGGVPSDIGIGQDFLRNIVTGSPDPLQDPRYKAFHQVSREEEEGAVNRLRRGAQVTGNLAASPSTGKEAKLRTGFGAQRMGLIGDIIQQNINRQLGAVPALQSGAMIEPNFVQNLIQMATTTGGLERVIDQARKDAEFSAKLNTLLFPFTTQAGLASNVLSRQGFSYDPGIQKPSAMSNISPILSSLILAGGMGGGGGGGGGGIGTGFSVPWGMSPYPGGGYL